jgi:hypothetical protein
VQAGDRAQLRERIRVPGDALAAGGDGLLHGLLEDRDQEIVLAAEIEVNGAGRDAGRTGDIGDLGVEEPARGEGRDGRPQQRVALVDLLATGDGGTGSAGGDGHE